MTAAPTLAAILIILLCVRIRRPSRGQGTSRETGTLLEGFRLRLGRSPHSMRNGAGVGGDLRGHCLARALHSRVFVDVIRGEDFAGRPGFR